MTSVHYEDSAVVADRDTVHGIELVGTRVVGILRGGSPIHQKLSVLVELGHSRAAVSVAHEERAVGQPGDIGWPVEESATVAAFLALGTKCHYKFSVVSELVNHVKLIIKDPYVLFGIVGTHLDLVGPSSTLHLEEFVMLGPRLNELAVTIHDKNDVVITAFPTTFFRRFTGSAQAIVIACSVAASGIELGVWRPWLRTRRQRQFTALRDPYAVGRLGKYGANGAPGPAVMLDAVRAIGQGLRPLFHQLVRSKLFLPAFLLRCCRRCDGGFTRLRRAAAGEDYKRHDPWQGKTYHPETGNAHCRRSFRV